jgi:hypothetical protein
MTALQEARHLSGRGMIHFGYNFTIPLFNSTSSSWIPP